MVAGTREVGDQVVNEQMDFLIIGKYGYYSSIMIGTGEITTALKCSFAGNICSYFCIGVHMDLSVPTVS
jgi:hypothetical protein